MEPPNAPKAARPPLNAPEERRIKGRARLKIPAEPARLRPVLITAAPVAPLAGLTRRRLQRPNARGPHRRGRRSPPPVKQRRPTKAHPAPSGGPRPSQRQVTAAAGGCGGGGRGAGEGGAVAGLKHIHPRIKEEVVVGRVGRKDRPPRPPPAAPDAPAVKILERAEKARVHGRPPTATPPAFPAAAAARHTVRPTRSGGLGPSLLDRHFRLF